jgi:hypothetical protein
MMKCLLALLLFITPVFSPVWAQTPADSTYGFGPPPQQQQAAPPPQQPDPPPQPGHTLRGISAANDDAPPCRNAAANRQLKKLDGELAQVAALLVSAKKALADLQTGAALRSSAVTRTRAQLDQIATLQARIANATRAQALVQQQAAYIRRLQPC